MARNHVFDSAIVTANQWLTEIATALKLSPADDRNALLALRAGLHAIRDRLPTNEVLDLGAQLPTVIRGVYFEGWSRHHDPRTIRDREDLIARVTRELGEHAELDPTDVLGAVIRLLVAHVSAGEIHDIVSTLPRPIATLWQELTHHTIDVLDVKHPKRARAERTGYSR